MVMTNRPGTAEQMLAIVSVANDCIKLAEDVCDAAVALQPADGGRNNLPACRLRALREALKP